MTDPTNPQTPPRGMTPELLPEDLSWAAGGHASDVALTAMADGQIEILPAAVRLHIERCTVCTTHLGHVALLSIHVGAELAAAVAPPRARPPFPWMAVGGGLVVAAIGSVPSLVDARVSVSTAVARDIAFFVRNATALRHAIEPGSPMSLVLTYGTAALLLAIGLGVARTVSRNQKEVSR